MHYNVHHNGLDVDGVYKRENADTAFLKIGPMSQTSTITVWDFQVATEPPDQHSYVDIARACSIGGNVNFYIHGNHDMRRVTTSHLLPLMPKTNVQFQPKQVLKVGNDVWIGNGATIMGGLTIGDGACIGAMAVVTHDVPPYALVVGTPARVLRYRFSERQIAALLRIQWWNWPLEKIKANVALLHGTDIDLFIETHDPAPEPI